MGEYYGVVRAPNYLSHALERGSGGVAVYNNHKYIARAMTSSGKYRYFYDSLELAAYKNQRMNQKNSLTKLSDSPNRPSTASASASSGSKSLREKWEERRGLLTSKGGKGSGGSGGGGGGSGKSSGGKGSGGHGKSSKAKGTSVSSKGTVIKAVNSQEGPKHYGHLSSGALKYQGENDPNRETVSNPTKKKKKQIKLSKYRNEQIKLSKYRNARGFIPLSAVPKYRR